MNVATLYIEPGSPWQNGYAKSFHSRLRDEFLAIEEFETLGAAKRLTRAWKEDYNNCRPHSSLPYRTPAAIAAACIASASDAPTLQANLASWKVSHAALLLGILLAYQLGGLMSCWYAKQQAYLQEASPASLLAGLLPSETRRAAPLSGYGSAISSGGMRSLRCLQQSLALAPTITGNWEAS